jgi:hypothetical protein
VKPHRLTCPECDGTGYESIACRCGTGRGSMLLAHPDECVCEAPECETCSGCGEIACEDDRCEECADAIEATARGLMERSR